MDPFGAGYTFLPRLRLKVSVDRVRKNNPTQIYEWGNSLAVVFSLRRRPGHPCFSMQFLQKWKLMSLPTDVLLLVFLWAVLGLLCSSSELLNSFSYQYVKAIMSTFLASDRYLLLTLIKLISNTLTLSVFRSLLTGILVQQLITNATLVDWYDFTYFILQTQIICNLRHDGNYSIHRSKRKGSTEVPGLNDFDFVNLISKTAGHC